ncbi:transcription factor TFIIH complex subunit Tfb6 [Schizosaccharomyces osmophilus]|uniref:Transcription factor TFIIH complex subunit Tfb6 n=1 Tax=Schizosaccharomyces osmophilus TaxID=2545709 RepID=A0AAF0AYG8_9SCHI|nr:transcription factor TFIIH complex subunit Tfb6 [Schizosaccharomyces osmophilus]WBW75020.1 transcription factor TFIIH complex subunit Tfb6 [Schizosaccharomyces osmophilus]
MNDLTESQLNNLRDYLDEQLLNVSQKFQKKFLPGGFQSLDDLIRDIEPYFRVLAAMPMQRDSFLAVNATLRGLDFFVDSIVAFPPAPEPMFQALSLLDSLCLKLVQHGNISTTDTIRLKSLMENSRMVVISKLGEVQGFELECSSVFERTLNDIDF